MTMMIALAALGALLASGQAFATCQVSLNGVSFGSVSPSTRTDGTGRIRVDCDEPGSYEVAIAGSNGPRTMQGPHGAVLRYELYMDTGRHIVWGDGSGNGDPLGASSDGTSIDSFTIYGAVPSQPSASPGDYADAPLVTLSF
jgi:spore coat protein U-like protein